ncbi:DNA repair protein complementing XP-C cells homolog [Amphiura filiformis]|uniref:DNA repair protein complementing XP-C cells homolog n=1 Tax=Amphiura filiformis TaxID=82378 RepID=UPI003B221C81
MPRRSTRTNNVSEKDTTISGVRRNDKSKTVKSSNTGKETKAKTSNKRKMPVRSHQDGKHHAEKSSVKVAEGDLSDESDFDMQSSPPLKTPKATKTKQTVRSKNAKKPVVKQESGIRTKRKKDVKDDESDHQAKKQNMSSVKIEQTIASKSTDETNQMESSNKRKRKGTKASEAVKSIPPKKNSRQAKTQANEFTDTNDIPIKKQKGKRANKSPALGKESTEYTKVNAGVKKEGKREVLSTEGNMEVGRRVKEEEDEITGQVVEMSSDSSESEWEEVEDLPLDVIDPEGAGPSGDTKPKEPVEISIDVSGGNTRHGKRKQKYEEMWRRYLQWQVNKSNKELQENLHKVHLLCLLASGLRSSSLCNDVELLCIALSQIPDSIMPRSTKKVDNYYLPRFFKWFKSSFEIDAELKDDSCHPVKDKLIQRLETRKMASENELVHVCILLLRALGLDVRLIASLHPITIKATKLTKANKKLSKAKANKSTPRSSKPTEKKAPHSKTKPVTSKFFQSSHDKPGSSSSTNKTKDSSATNSKTVNKNKRTTAKSKKTKDENPQENTKTGENTQSSVPSGPRPKNRQPRQCASKVKPIIELSGSEVESSSDDYEAMESGNDSDYEESESKKSVRRKKQNSAVRKKRTTTLSGSDSDYEDQSAVVQKKHPANGRRQHSVTHSKSTKEADSDCEELGSTSKQKKKGKVASKKTEKSKQNSGGDSSVEELNSDSDFEVEVLKVASGPRSSASSSGEGSGKKKSRKMVSSDSGESVEIIKTKGNFKQGTDTWLEVYCASDKAWICVDCVHGHVKRPELCESYASKPISYVVAFDNEGSIKDITHRYDSKWMIGTQKLRVDSEWWQETLRPFRTRNTRRDREEDDQLQGKLMNKPLPTTISEYKGHPLYALKRHLLKFEGLYPETAAILGYCRGEAVYARECVHELHTRQTWLKEAKSVRIGEKPYKMVKARPKRNQPMETEPSLEVFGEWQTEDYEPPIAVDGIVPRNEHGNVELFKECMLPKGTVHMRLVGLNRIARKLEIDCAPAMTGWDFHSGFCHPVLDGYVVCEEYEDLLEDAWHKEQQEIEKKNRKKKEERALKNWKLLIKGVLIRERLNKRFRSDDGAGTSSPSKSKAKKSEKVSWPKNRMTAFEGDESNRLPFEKL